MYYTVQLIQQTFYKNLTGRGHEKSRISAASEAFNAWLYSVTTVENPYCYTQATDVEQEVNGLMTPDRKFKISPEKIRKINEKTTAFH